MTKNKTLVVAALGLGATAVAGNTLTNLAITKKAGYVWNKETKKMEKMCPFGIDFDTEDKIYRNNMIWSIGSIVVGSIVGSIIRKNYNR